MKKLQPSFCEILRIDGNICNKRIAESKYCRKGYPTMTRQFHQKAYAMSVYSSLKDQVTGQTYF
jgi:hypothetical protein